MKKQEKLLNNYRNMVDKIKKIDFTQLNNEELLNKSNYLKELISKEIDINEVVLEAFALVKEVIKRTLGFEVYDVQLLAALALNDKKLIEMQTGEGKTLTAVFSAYINSLYGKGVHVLTFNDYLAKRDAKWMKPIYDMLGVNVGFIQENMSLEDKRKAYYCDITYVTAKEAGFDYLRDSIAYSKEELVHRPFYCAIVDEADSILIDEARIPLVIATSTNEKDYEVRVIREVVATLESEIDYTTDEYDMNIFLTENGISKVEKLLGCGNLYDNKNFNLLRLLNSTLYAEIMLKRDIDYIVKNNTIEMIDEFTGRIAKNRHWADGIQAALEVKENLEVQCTSKILAQITLQHFVKLYENLAGMTGTAMDSEDEFFEYYDLELVTVPPNRKCIRKDLDNIVFTHKEAKYKALVKEVQRVNSTGQPILIGTSNVKESTYLASKLLDAGIRCQVLNAVNDELEAKVIEQAGVLGAVTVSTNMAGRGVDILLGGPEGNERERIIRLGGLYVIGTNLYESLRIDKQLKGRAGRQGEPGLTRFFISLEDDLIVKYGISEMIPKKYYPILKEEALSNPIFNYKINKAQKVIQAKLSDFRKSLYEYSIVLEQQRLYMYDNRIKVMNGEIEDSILNCEYPELYEVLKKKYDEDTIKVFKKNLMLFHINEYWSDYLIKVSIIKDGSQFNVYAGKNPLSEFNRTIIDEFKNLHEEIKLAIKDDYNELNNSKVTFLELNNRNKNPLSTWTYLMNDNSIDAFMGFLPGIALINLVKSYGLGNIRDSIDSLEFAIRSYLYKLSRKDAI